MKLFSSLASAVSAGIIRRASVPLSIRVRLLSRIKGSENVIVTCPVTDIIEIFAITGVHFFMSSGCRGPFLGGGGGGGTGGNGGHGNIVIAAFTSTVRGSTLMS